jgi:hypothetical protein
MHMSLLLMQTASLHRLLYSLHHADVDQGMIESVFSALLLNPLLQVRTLHS